MVAIVVVGFFVQNSNSNNLKRIYLISVFFFAFLYAGLRGRTVGLDTDLWNTIFDNIAKNGLSELPRNTEVEKGYMFLNLLLSKIWNSSQSVILVSSAIINYSFYKIIKRYSKDYMLSALIYVSTIFTITMNTSRQYLALAIVFFAFSFILEKKQIKAVLLILLASSMHYSAIVMLPLALFALPNINMTLKSLVLVGGASFMAIPLYMVVVNLFVSVFPQYSRFIESSKYSAELEISMQYVLLFILIVFLGLLYIIPFRFSDGKLYINRNNDMLKAIEDKGEQFIYLLFFLLFVEYVVVYFISRNLLIAARFTYYFQTSLIIMIPNTIYYLRRRYQMRAASKFVTLIFVVYFCWFGFRYFLADPHGIFPYAFFWS